MVHSARSPCGLGLMPLKSRLPPPHTVAPPSPSTWPSPGTATAFKASPIATVRRSPRTRRAAFSVKNADSSSRSPAVTVEREGRDDGEVAQDGHGYYSYRGHRVHFERRGNPVSASRILLLHGFGVGSFHFRSQLEGLTTGDDDDCDASSRCVYALDFCGQGSSWPPTDAAGVKGAFHPRTLPRFVWKRHTPASGELKVPAEPRRFWRPMTSRPVLLRRASREPKTVCQPNCREREALFSSR